MELTFSILAFLLLSSVSVNIFQYRENKKFRARGPESYEVKDLLQDLLGGRALIEVRRIASSDVFLRSPKDR